MLLSGCLDGSLGSKALVLLLHKEMADVLDVSLRSYKGCLQLPCALDKTCKQGIVSQNLPCLSYMMQGKCGRRQEDMSLSQLGLLSCLVSIKAHRACRGSPCIRQGSCSFLVIPSR